MAKLQAKKKVSGAKAASKKTTTKSAASSPKSKAPAKAAKKAVFKSYNIAEGGKIPAVTAPATSGKTLAANALSKGTVVLYFYPKDNTPGCTLEGQDFRKLYKKFKEAGAEVYGASQDSLASHEKFKTKCDFPFELLSDESGELCKAFDVIQMKSMYGREFMGIERSTFVVQNGVIKKEWRKVKVNGHAQEVLDFVKGL